MSNDYIRHAVAYLERTGTQGIVASQHYNGTGGVLIEDDGPVVLAAPDAATLTTALREALARSCVRSVQDLRSRKKTDWPCFQASRSRSVLVFESSFIRVSIRGANSANATYVIEGWPDTSAYISINTSVAAASPDLGERCLTVWQICRDRTFQRPTPRVDLPR